MKKVFFVSFCTLFVFALCSCKKNEGYGGPPSFYGEWAMQSSTTKTYEGTPGTLTVTDTYNPATDGVYTLNFRADSDLINMHNGDTTSRGTWSYNDSTKELRANIESIGFFFQYDVRKLTWSNFVLHSEVSYTDDDGKAIRVVSDNSFNRR